MPDYTVKTEGFILGMWRKKRETISLEESQAKTFLREGRIDTKAESEGSRKAKVEPKSD